MTDYHLYDFMRCPHKFYFRHIKRRKPSSFEWQQIAQMIVNQIINEYYTLPAGQQTKIVLLILIEKYWKKVRINMFASKTEYYIVLAKLTDHLLQFVERDDSQTPPLFLYEKFQKYMEESFLYQAVAYVAGTENGKRSEMKLNYEVKIVKVNNIFMVLEQKQRVQ